MVCSMRVCLCLLVCGGLLVAASSSSGPKVAVIGGGIGGTAAAYFLRQQQPSWHIELFEADRLGGRTQEFTLDGKTYELGASIVHRVNEYVLGLARQMNLTVQPADDSGEAAFNIWDGSNFVFSQSGAGLADMWAVAKRYGISPLRYKWLATKTGGQFGRIYSLQQQGKAFDTPQAWLEAVGLFNATQQSAAGYMAEHLSSGWLRYGSGPFIEELAGAINRINYNQRNAGLNALAGLVSYLPAADPRVFSIKEGNAALPTKLAEAAKLQGLHVRTTITAIQASSSRQYTLTGVKRDTPDGLASGAAPGVTATAAGAAAAAATEARGVAPGTAAEEGPASGWSAVGTLLQRIRGHTGVTLSAQYKPGHQGRNKHQHQQRRRRKRRQQANRADKQHFGPFDAVILASPLEGSGIQLQGFNPEPQLPKRRFQSTVTTYVTGYLDANYFNRAKLPEGDIFVTSAADTPFSVVASQGMVSAGAAVAAAAMPQPSKQHQRQGDDEAVGAASNAATAGQPEQPLLDHSSQHEQPQQQQPGAQVPGAAVAAAAAATASNSGSNGSNEEDQLPLWKVFSEEPLSWRLLRTLFVNGTIVVSKAWAAYPRFDPPEQFAPFTLAPGLCYNNALENAASAMEVAAVAAKNCVLLIEQGLAAQRHAGLHWPGGSSGGAVAAA